MKKNFIPIISAALLLAACSQQLDDVTSIAEDTQICFNVNYPQTKASNGAFEAKDKIGIYMTEYSLDGPSALQIGGNFKNNVPVTFDGIHWTATPAIYWGEKEYDVYAYYPYGTPNSIHEMVFPVARNQCSSAETGTMSPFEASDFLYAEAKGLTKSSGAVNLTFSHIMSRITINLLKGDEFEGEMPDNATVIIHNTVPDALVDLSTGDVIKDPYGTAQDIYARKVSTTKYTAIVVPQMITNKIPLFEVVFSDVSYLIETKFQFKSGMHHTVDVTLNDNPEKVKIEIGGEISNDWN